jgi:hypothetical protein
MSTLRVPNPGTALIGFDSDKRGIYSRAKIAFFKLKTEIGFVILPLTAGLSGMAASGGRAICKGEQKERNPGRR